MAKAAAGRSSGWLLLVLAAAYVGYVSGVRRSSPPVVGAEAAPGAQLVPGVQTTPVATPGKTNVIAMRLLQRCRVTYDGLKSYQGTTHVDSTITMGTTGPMHISTSADVKFQRPGQIWVQGNLFMTSDQYTFVSDGH